MKINKFYHLKKIFCLFDLWSNPIPYHFMLDAAELIQHVLHAVVSGSGGGEIKQPGKGN